jgi:long-chain acyl-CoA synthetase
MNIVRAVQNSAQLHADRVAWRFGDREASYSSLRDRVSRLAAGLHDAGLRRGDRVVLFLPNSPELVEMLLGSLWAGMIAVPVNWHLHADEVAFIVRHCGARAILLSEQTAAAAAPLAGQRDRPLIVDVQAQCGEAYESLLARRTDGAAIAERAADEPAWLFYTSGTTGRPKGATLSHRNLLAMTLNYFADVDAVADAAVFLHAAPLTHGSGLYLLPAITRAATNIIATSTRFDPAEYLSLIEQHRVTHGAFLAPTMLRRLTDREDLNSRDLSSLRSVVVGGAPLYQSDLAAALAGFGPIVTQIYGQGEAPMTVTCMRASELGQHPGALVRLGSCGRSFVGVEIRILAEDGSLARTGEPGEVCVRGDVVMNGYWNDTEATAQTIRDGWLHTGDIGHLDAEGYLSLTDRAKDVIITGGSNVYPREVEEILLTHPGVREVAVIGTPDSEWGESICAYVVRAPNVRVSDEDLIRHCQQHLASFKKPRHVVFTESLPKNATGKVLKRELREMTDR